MRDRQLMTSTISMIINIVVSRRRDRGRETSGESDVKKKQKGKKGDAKKWKTSDHVCFTRARKQTLSVGACAFSRRIRFHKCDRNIYEIVEVVIEKNRWLIARHVVLITKSHLRFKAIGAKKT